MDHTTTHEANYPGIGGRCHIVYLGFDDCASIEAGVTSSGLDNPQLVERGYWRRLEHPVMGTIVGSRVPFRSVPDEGAPRSAAPLLGQHTREIAASVLGIDGPAYDELVAREVFV